MGGSPRRAKRFVNLYHLLKTSLRDVPAISNDVRLDQRALIVALAVVTGAPHSASTFFRALAPDAGESTYVDLRSVMLRLSESGGSAVNSNARAILQHLVDINKNSKLNDGREVSNGPDMTRALSQLASTVRRYSFEMVN